MYNIHIIDIVIVILYFIVCIGIGLYKYKSVTTLKDYTLGGRNFPNLVIITTLLATHIGAASTMGVVGKEYTFGIFFVVTRLVMSFTMWAVTALIYGKNIDRFRDCISVSDIMNKLYGNAGRSITNIVAIPMSIVVVTVQATAMVHYFFEVPIFYSTIICTLLLAFYSAFGGIRAVAYTDVFQFIIIILVIPASCFIVYGMESEGGIIHWHKVLDQLPREMLILSFNKDNIWLFCSLVFLWFFTSD